MLFHIKNLSDVYLTVLLFLCINYKDRKYEYSDHAREELYQMDFLRIRYYIEVLAISLGLTLFYVIPMQIIQDGQPRVFTVALGMLLWFIIISRNETFAELIEKWFK